MPINISEHTTPMGARHLRADVSGFVTEEDASALLERARALGAEGPILILSVIGRGTEYSSESRRIFTDQLGVITRRCAAVVPSRAVRAAINFMVMVSGRGDNIRMFDSEPDGLAWLDEARYR